MSVVAAAPHATADTQPQTEVITANMSTISKDLIRQRFDKASDSYQTHNGVQKRIAKALLEMMPGQASSQGVLLDLGCGPGPDWHALRNCAQTYIGVDLSAAMLNAHQARQGTQGSPLMQADMEQLPLATASIDTLYSSMAIQWAASRPRLCKEIQRVLKPGGNAFVSVPLQGSLQPLGQIRQSMDAQPQVNPQPKLSDWVDAWTAAGCKIERAEQHRFTEYFDDLRQLLQSIKGVGAGANQANPLTRDALQSMAKSYEQARAAQGLPLHYEVGLVHIKRL